LTTTETLGFRALTAAVALVLAVVHWFGQGIRNLRHGDLRQLDAWRVGRRRWALACVGKRPCAPVEPVLWFDTLRGRASPATRPLPLLAVPFTSHCLAPPHVKQAEDSGGARERVVNWS